MSELQINVDALRIRDYATLQRIARNEADAEEVIALVERVYPGAADLPLRELKTILARIADVLNEGKDSDGG